MAEKKVETRGRKKTSEIDKARSRASRDYKLYQETLSDEFKAEHAAKEIQFAESDKTMGRPPVSLWKLQKRALDRFTKSLEVYRDLEKSEQVKPWSEEDIINYKAKDNAGRKKADEIDRLKKYIRRQLVIINDIKEEPEENFGKEHEGSGRPGMSKPAKIQHYENLIAKAQKEIDELMRSKSASERLAYDLKDAQIERRTYRTQFKAENSYVHDVSEHDLSVIKIEAQIHIAKQLESGSEADNEYEIKLLEEYIKRNTRVANKLKSLTTDELEKKYPSASLDVLLKQFSTINALATNRISEIEREIANDHYKALLSVENALDMTSIFQGNDSASSKVDYAVQQSTDESLAKVSKH